jgi:ankyrin repeat protein
VNLLLDSGAKTGTQNDKGWTALQFASQEGAIDGVKCLLTTGRADMNIGDGDCKTPLHSASQNHDTYDFWERNLRLLGKPEEQRI